MLAGIIRRCHNQALPLTVNSWCVDFLRIFKLFILKFNKSEFVWLYLIIRINMHLFRPLQI